MGSSAGPGSQGPDGGDVSLRLRLGRWLLRREAPPAPEPQPQGAQPAPCSEPQDQEPLPPPIDMFGFECAMGHADESRGVLVHPVDGSAPYRIRSL
jgi:hypothetical protein